MNALIWSTTDYAQFFVGANIRYEEVLVCRSEVSKVHLVEIPSHTPVQQDVHHPGP